MAPLKRPWERSPCPVAAARSLPCASAVSHPGASKGGGLPMPATAHGCRLAALAGAPHQDTRRHAPADTLKRPCLRRWCTSWGRTLNSHNSPCCACWAWQRSSRACSPGTMHAGSARHAGAASPRPPRVCPGGALIGRRRARTGSSCCRWARWAAWCPRRTGWGP